MMFLYIIVYKLLKNSNEMINGWVKVKLGNHTILNMFVPSAHLSN